MRSAPIANVLIWIWRQSGRRAHYCLILMPATFGLSFQKTQHTPSILLCLCCYTFCFICVETSSGDEFPSLLVTVNCVLLPLLVVAVVHLLSSDHNQTHHQVTICSRQTAAPEGIVTVGNLVLGECESNIWNASLQLVYFYHNKKGIAMISSSPNMLILVFRAKRHTQYTRMNANHLD